MSEKRDHRVRDIERIKRLRLLDDIFMKVVLRGNIPGVQDIVRVILQRDDITVKSVEVQDELTNITGHAVRVDVLAEDTAGKFYNIEIQRAKEGAGAKRARYHLGAVDWNKFPAGADYDELAETWIIFITETDIFRRGLPVYTVNRFIEETGERFPDGGHIVYANASYVGDDSFGKLMADFRETDPKKMHYSSLSDKVHEYKETEGGISSMCWFTEEVRAEGIAEGIERGIEQGIERGIEQGRRNLIDTLLAHNSEESLLHSESFAGLNITRSEIEEAKKRLAV